jgi:predicted dehydrogenase
VNTNAPGSAPAPLRYDVVGCGAVTQVGHVPALRVLQARSELEIASCYDRNPALAERVAEMLGAEDWGTEATPRDGDGVDAALVATPPQVHAAIASRYLERGKSALVEKPFAPRASEAEDLVREASNHRARVAVNQLWRFYPSTEIARRWLRDQLGEVRSVEASEGFRWDWSPTSNYVVEDPWGGVIHDTGAHLIDAVLYLLGLDEDGSEPKVEIGRVMKTPATEPSHECRAQFDLVVPGGEQVGVELLISRLRPVARGIKVRGTFGTLFLPALFASAPILFRGSHGFRVRPAETATEPRDLGSCFLLAHAEFLAGVRDPEVTTRIDGARFLLLNRILESLHDRGGA